MKHKISILGSGFIGTHLVNACSALRWPVKVLDRGNRPDPLSADVVWIKGTFDNAEQVSEAINGSDTVFHFISNTVPGDTVEVSKELFDNVSQTLQLLGLCKEHNVRRLIFMSSSSVYGQQTVLPISETALPAPISSHAIQKLTLEYYLKLFTYEQGLDCKIIRLSNPYGIGQDLYGRQGIISIIAGKILENRAIPVRGNGGSIRDFVNITDVIDACLLLVETNSNESVFNIGSSLGLSLNNIIEEVSSLLGRKLEVDYQKERAADIHASVLDISLARNCLGYTPSKDIRDGLRLFLKSYNIL